MSLHNSCTAAILKMFFPVFVSRVGMYAMSLIDATMLAHYNALHLGFQSIGDTPVTFVLLALNGLIQGTLFITSEAFGQKDYGGAGQALVQGLKYGLCLSLVCVPLFFFGPVILSFFNYTPENIRISGTIMRILTLSIPFALLYLICQFFLQGIKRPWISTVFILIANLINILLNWLLIGGKLGFPALGGIGAALSSAAVRLFLGIGIITYILTRSEFRIYLQNKSRKVLSANKLQQQLGWGATANMLSTETAYAFCIFFISSVSIMSVSAYVLSYRFFMITGLLPVSLAVAASVFTGIGIGEKNLNIIKESISATLSLNSVFMLFLTLLAFTFAPQLSRILTGDPQLADAAAPLLKLVSLLLFFNGVQTILTINLRAMHDLIIPSVIIFGFYTLLVPAACLLFASDASAVIIILLFANTLTAGGLSLRLLYLLPRYKFK